MTTETEYTKQANDFLTKTGVKFSVKYLKYGKHFAGVKFSVKYLKYGKHFAGDKDYRHIFKARFQKGKNYFTVNFGQSLANGSEEPTAYDVLACLTKYDPETFEYFCSEFGYDTDSRSAYKLWNSAEIEYVKVIKMWSEDEIDLLQEIQ